MPQLEIYDPGIRSATDVWSAALAAHRKRVAAYERFSAKPSPEPLDEPAEQALPPSRRSVLAELSRQTGIPPSRLRKGDDSRGQPIVAIRQLGMALLIKLSGMSLPATARIFCMTNHTTILHAKRAMAPVLDATGLTESDSVRVWIETALPILFVHVGEIRRKNREHGVAMYVNLLLTGEHHED
jgi:hypothetical protein